MASGIWNTSQWNGAQWHAGRPPPIKPPAAAGWGTDWRWWYQYTGGTQGSWDLSAMVVEAQWSTEAHTMGDGTFRGDLQPGHLTLKLNDQQGLWSTLDMRGTVWARYNPTGETWCYFIDSITSGLSPPGSPERWNVVIAGNTWAQRLTTASYLASLWPEQSVNARLNAVANNLNTDTGLFLPAVAAAIDPDAHLIPALVQGSSAPASPPHIQQARDAGALGVVWLDALSGPNLSDAGTLVLHYAVWGNTTERAIDEAQYNAGTAWSYGYENVRTRLTWAATSYLGATSSLDIYSGGYGSWGVTGMTPRIWGDVTVGAAQEQPCRTISTAIFDAVGAPHPHVNQIMATSGNRMQADGTPGPAWDPTAHVWKPTDVMVWNREGTTEKYRVTQTAHRLTVWRWESMHTLEVYVPAATMPT